MKQRPTMLSEIFLKRTKCWFISLFLMASAAGAQAQSAPSVVGTPYAESKFETDFNLTATVNPNGADTSVTFQYSTDSTFSAGVSSVGPFNVGSGNSGVEVVGPISGLNTASTWYWRLQATNASGTTSSTAQRIFKVAVMPSYAQGVKYGKVLLGGARNVWGKVWGGTAPYTYEFDYGDGTTATGNVTDANYIQTNKTYATSGTKRYTLKVTDASGHVAARSGTIRVLPYQSTADRVDMAIEKGLVYLYRTTLVSSIDSANMLYWAWGSSAENSEYNIGTTGAALLAFAENEHLPSEDPVEEVYAPLTVKTRNYLLKYATEVNITNHTDGIAVRDSDSNDNGKGVYFPGSGSHFTYSSNQAAIAIIMTVKSAAEAQAMQVPYGPLANTRTYYELVRDVCDQLLWAQGDGAQRGAFQYQLNTTSQSYDGSTMQWPSLTLGAARDRLGIPLPDWFNDNAAHGFNYLTDAATGGVGYGSSTSWRNLAKTGGALAALSFGGRYVDDNAQATKNRDYIGNYWFANLGGSNDHAGWTGHWYAMYGLKKGLSLQGIVSLSTTTGARDWQQDFNAWLLGDATLLDSQGGQIGLAYRTATNMFGQQADGRWRSADWPSSDATSDKMTTANAILVMSSSVTRAVPVAVIEPIPQQTNKPLGRSFEVDGSKSYHLDSDSAIVQYLWDFDSSDGLDWDYPDATGSIVTNPGYSAVGTYTITLLVRDNANPAATNMVATTVSVTDQDVAPIAIAKPRGTVGSYAGRVGEPITLDGSDSYDPDGDEIVAYNWDLDGDGLYDDATGVTTTVTFATPYEGSIGLQVTANGKTSNNRATLDIQAGEKDLDLESVAFTNVIPRVSADIAMVLKNDPISGLAFNGVKLRLFNGNPYAGGGPIGSTYTVDFAPGQTVNLNLPAASLGGSAVVWVYLDTDNSVVEFDETNNVLGPYYLDSEIAVEDALSNNLIDGQIVPDFGTIGVDSSSAARTYTIKNVGTFDLTGLAVTVDGTNSGDFTVTQPALTTLAPNTSTTFTVSFAPTAIGARSAVVKIASSDYDENPFDLRVSGTANLNRAPTAISLSSSSLVEGNAANATVGNLQTTDLDDGDTFTYTLVAGAGDTDNGSFTIVGGALKITPVTDYETKTSYSIRVKTTDAGGLSYETSLTVSVVNLNEAPAGTDGVSLVIINEPYTYGTTDFGFTDPNDSPANAFARVKLTTIPAAGRGTLTLSGVPVSAGDFITVADLNAGNLVYTPPTDVYGLDYTQLTFQVEDDGGTANSGVNLDPTANTLRIHVGNIPIVVTTAEVFDVTAFTARVTGSVRLYGITTSIWFEYSQDSGMAGALTASVPDKEGFNLETVEKVLSELAEEKKYYYRLVASNPYGLVRGEVRSFITSFPISSAETVEDLPPETEIYRPMPGPINAAGKILTKMYAYVGIGGITARDDAFLMTDASPLGNMAVIGRESQNAAGLGKMRGFFENLLLTDNGKSVFTENFSGSGRGHTAHLLTDNGALPLEVVALTGDALPEGGSFKVLNGTPVVDGSDRIYFSNARTGTGINAKNDTGIWYDEAGSMNLLAMEGEDAQLADAAWIGNIRSDVVAGGTGAAFISMLQNNPANSRQRTLAAKNMAVFDTDVDGAGARELVVRKGDAVPGTAGVWNNLTAVSRSSTGHHLVLGLMARKSGVSTANDQVLVAVLANGDKHLVAREGITVIPGTGLVIDRFAHHFIATTGDVVFRGYLRGGSQVVCRWSATTQSLSLVVAQGAALSDFVAPADLPAGLAGDTVGLIQRVTVSPAGHIGMAVVSSRADARNLVLRDMAGGTGLEVMEYSGREVWYRNEAFPIITLSIYEIKSPAGATGGMGSGINDSGEIAITMDLGSRNHVIRIYTDNVVTLLSRY